MTADCGEHAVRNSTTAASNTVLWDLDPHTIAKHRLLRAYLDRWLPIMATHQEKLLLVDGFAGPGRYAGGQDGSPIIMIRAFAQHSQRPRIERTKLDYFFIERHDGRFAHLQEEIERLKPLPANVSAVPVHGEYGALIAGVLGTPRPIGCPRSPSSTPSDTPTRTSN